MRDCRWRGKRFKPRPWKRFGRDFCSICTPSQLSWKIMIDSECKDWPSACPNITYAYSILRSQTVRCLNCRRGSSKVPCGARGHSGGGRRSSDLWMHNRRKSSTGSQMVSQFVFSSFSLRSADCPEEGNRGTSVNSVRNGLIYHPFSKSIQDHSALLWPETTVKLFWNCYLVKS